MFRPSLHGWPFGNAFTCDGPELGIGAPPPPELGLAGGLCWAALDRYLRGVSIPRDTPAPEPGDPLHAELIQRQVAAVSGLWPRVRAWQALPDGSWRDRVPVRIPLPGSDLASRTRSEWRTLRRRLGADEPVLLTLLLRSEGYRRSRAASQVLATGWSREGRRVTLSIYDPARPDNDDIELAFNLIGPLDARVSGMPPLRGFFPVPYDRERVPTLRTQSFDDRSVIGLNRKVRGRVSPAAGRNGIALVARNERGALLHFHRSKGRHWEGANVTETADFGAHELHSDPVAFQRAGALHAFARSYTGDLLHFRYGRSWSLANRTEHKRAGPRFRLTGRPIPVPRPWLQLSVLGRDPNGGLVHYEAAPFRGWRAEQVPGDPVADDPVAECQGDAVHVAAVAEDGRLLHWCLEDEWAMTHPDMGPGPSVRLAGPPALVLRDGKVHVFGRDRDDSLAILTLHEDGVWQRTLLGEALTGAPAATTGPAGLHVFAPTEGGVLHAWQQPGGIEWEWEDLVASRTTLPGSPSGPGDVVCWGSDDRLRVFVRRGAGLRVFTWTPDADWVADPVITHGGEPPVLLRDHAGRPHLITTDGRGTVRHIENGPWKEPDRVDADRKSAATTGTATTGTATKRAAGKSAPDKSVAGKRAPGKDAPAAAGSAGGGGSAKAAETPSPPPLPSNFDLPLLDDPADEPADEPADDSTPSGSEDQLLDFEAERLMDVPDRRATEAEPDAAAASNVSLEVEPEAGEPETPADPAVPTREFRWEDQAPPASPTDIEPMDLSLLDTWPPKRRRTKREDAQESGAGGEPTDREAS